MKFTAILIGSLLTMSTLAGCGLKSAFDMDNSNTNQNQLCNRLKRDIVFYSYEHNNDTAWSSPARQAQILRDYKENNCEAILSGKADGKGERTESTAFSLPSHTRPSQNNVQIRQQS